MPSKPSRKSSDKTGSPAQSKQQKRAAKQSGKASGPSVWRRMADFFRSDTLRIVVGIVWMMAVCYLFFAFLSYFFDGAKDQSILDLADTSARRLQTSNWTGVVGAGAAEALINRGFGLAAYILLFAAFVVGLRLFRVKWRPLWRTLFRSAFWLVWTSVAISFCFSGIYMNGDSFFSWGGSFGDMVCSWVVSYIKPLGMLLLLVSLLTVFLILAYRDTLPRIRAWIARLKEKREQRRLAAQGTAAAMQTNGETVTIDLTNDLTDISNPTDEPKEDEQAREFTFTDLGTTVPGQEGGDVEFTIDTPNPEDSQTVTEPAEPAGTEEKKDDDVELDINEVKPVETTDEDPYWNLQNLGPYDPRLDLSHYEFPSLSLLKTYPNENMPVIDPVEQQKNKERIVTTLHNFGIEIESIKATIGPTITLYEIVPRAGTRISKIRGLENDIMLALAAKGIRIIAPIPGKGTIGIEVPNEKPQIVSMHSVIASKKFQEEEKMALPIALGRTITNEVFMFDLAKTPHLLVAGATGQGKSVGLNAIITSLLYKKHPAELKFVLVDPKMVEFSIYRQLEKYYMAMMPDEEKPIITDSTKVISTLNSLVIEMENRYELVAKAGCRNIAEYNEKFIKRQLNPEKGHRYLPYIVIVIDEFGDFIMVAGKEVELPISRITQKARAVGMHMILATQRPSANIITGVIKANIPTRISFKVSQQLESRIILDASGAQQLVGKGDLLYSTGNDPVRVQCAFVDTPEVEAIVDNIAQQQSYSCAYQLPDYVPGEGGSSGETYSPGSVDLRKRDPLFTDVARFVVQQQQGSTSVIQRHFEIGYNRAGKISDQLEAAGIVGPNRGSKGRDVLIQDEISLTQLLESLNRM